MPDGRACRPEISCPQPSPDGWLGVLYCFRLPVELGWLRSGDTIKIRILGIVVLGAALSGCAFQRAQIAQDAQANMIGMPKEQVLACMGPPVNKATEGKTEVWAYSTSPTINLDRGSGATHQQSQRVVPRRRLNDRDHHRSLRSLTNRAPPAGPARRIAARCSRDCAILDGRRIGARKESPCAPDDEA
jgi:hypothetical protein